MKMKTPAFILSLFVCFFFSINVNVYAQSQSEDDKVQSLGDILNPKADDMLGAKTTQDMANIYFKRCLKTKTLAFDDEEKEMLCACTSANMGQVLTVSEFNVMHEDNLKGKDARGKVIAFAYTKCTDYVIESKLYNDCMVSPVLKSITRGKKDICECSAKEYVQRINKEMSYIIMESLKYDPMTLNPLERFFTTTNYGYMSEHYTKACRAKLLYQKHN